MPQCGEPVSPITIVGLSKLQGCCPTDVYSVRREDATGVPGLECRPERGDGGRRRWLEPGQPLDLTQAVHQGLAVHAECGRRSCPRAVVAQEHLEAPHQLR